VALSKYITAGSSDEALLKEYFEAVDAKFTANLMAMFDYSPKPPPVDAAPAFPTMCGLPPKAERLGRGRSVR
jgi:hypothetical protein